MDYEEEQYYLQEMHKQGWRFVKVSGIGIYRFEECEPEDMVYQLDYNKEGLEHRTEYIQMFQDCGWEYLQDFMGFSYFRKAAAKMQGEESIFCDDASRMEMIQRVLEGRILRLVVMLLIFGIILSVIFMYPYNSGVVDYLAGAFTGVLIVFGAVFIKLVMKYIEFRKKAGL